MRKEKEHNSCITALRYKVLPYGGEGLRGTSVSAGDYFFFSTEVKPV